MRKAKLDRLERETRSEREMEISKEVFLNSIAHLKAAANGEASPPEHPRARDPRFASPFSGIHVIRGGTVPIPDLSEE